MSGANPWGLSESEIKVMDAMCETGCTKGAANKLRTDAKYIENRCFTAGQKMGLHHSRLLKYLEWDRWRRNQLVEVRHQ